MSDRTRKLVSIRHRTDHDLLVLVKRELDRGFALADVATTRTSRLLTQAARADETARALCLEFPVLTVVSACKSNRA